MTDDYNWTQLSEQEREYWFENAWWFDWSLNKPDDCMRWDER